MRIVLVLQARPLLFDLLQALLLGGEVRAQRRQLFAHRLQAAPVVLELPLGALQLGPSIGERGAGFRGGGFPPRRSPFSRSLTRSDSSSCLTVERIAFDRQAAWSALQAVVRVGQGLEFPLRLEVSDFGALDLDQGLIDRRQGVVELRTDQLRYCGTRIRWRRGELRKLSLRRPIESKVRATFSDFGVASPMRP